MAGERKCLRNTIESNMAKWQKIDLSILEEVTMVSGLIKISSFLEKPTIVQVSGCFLNCCGNFKLYHIAKFVKSQDLWQEDTWQEYDLIFAVACIENVYYGKTGKDRGFLKKISCKFPIKY